MTLQQIQGHTSQPWAAMATPLKLDPTDGFSMGFPVHSTVDSFVPLAHVFGGATDAEAKANKDLIALAPTAPHQCSPDCPGDVNRRRLECWEEVVEALAECKVAMAGTDWPVRKRIEAAIEKARAAK